MRIAIATLFGLALPPLTAQDRLLQPEDVAARKTAAAVLAFGIDSVRTLGHGEGVERLHAAVGTARQCLPAGSAARAALDAIAGASRNPEALVLALSDLVDDLTFQPVAEAELPAGVPGFQALNEIELRHYPTYRMVRSAMRGGAMGAFWPLFNHIKEREIAMTTPVQIDYRQDGQRQREASMAFLYGSPSLGPTGKAGEVEVVDVPAMTVLTIGSRGYDRPARVAELRARLADWLARHPEWELAGAVRTMGYNSPSIGGERRYFEVQLPVRQSRTVEPLRQSV
jgi:hypothetical protein